MDGVKVEAAKQKAKSEFKSAGKYLLTFLKWFVLAAVTGAVGGVVGALFHLSVEYVTGVRKAHSWIVFLLPVGGLVIAGLDDSKKLSEKRREALYDEITQKALHWHAAFASVEEIGKLNILGATYLAMNRAIAGLGAVPELALIDGNRAAGVEHNCKCVVSGDGKCADIAAASIIAKVTRDRLMYELDKEYPGYGFAKHKGYGTAAHYAAIRGLGPCPAHRPSFLRKMH